MEFALLKRMEDTLKRKQAVLADMREKGDESACDFECRVIGYKNAVDDMRIGIESEVEKMAEDYGE